MEQAEQRRTTYHDEADRDQRDARGSEDERSEHARARDRPYAGASRDQCAEHAEVVERRKLQYGRIRKQLPHQQPGQRGQSQTQTCEGDAPGTEPSGTRQQPCGRGDQQEAADVDLREGERSAERADHGNRRRALSHLAFASDQSRDRDEQHDHAAGMTRLEHIHIQICKRRAQRKHAAREGPRLSRNQRRANRGAAKPPTERQQPGAAAVPLEAQHAAERFSQKEEERSVLRVDLVEDRAARCEVPQRNQHVAFVVVAHEGAEEQIPASGQEDDGDAQRHQPRHCVVEQVRTRRCVRR